MQREEIAPVEQIDREAAAELECLPSYAEAIRSGKQDASRKVQAFARHRIAQLTADSAALEAARGEIERLRTALVEIAAAEPTERNSGDVNDLIAIAAVVRARAALDALPARQGEADRG